MKQKKIWEDEKNLEINTKTKFWMERHRHQCRFNLGNQLISLKMMKTIELTKSEFWWCNFQSKDWISHCMQEILQTRSICFILLQWSIKLLIASIQRVFIKFGTYCLTRNAPQYKSNLIKQILLSYIEILWWQSRRKFTTEYQACSIENRRFSGKCFMNIFFFS